MAELRLDLVSAVPVVLLSSFSRYPLLYQTWPGVGMSFKLYDRARIKFIIGADGD